MNKTTLIGIALAGSLLAFGTAAHAVPTESICDCTDIVVPECPDCDDGTGDYIEVGAVEQDTSGNHDSVDQYGEIPDWYTSGKWHMPNTACDWDRLEARWKHVDGDTGRAWGRVTFWPLTIEDDSALLSTRAWDDFGTDPRLIRQQAAFDDVKLRLHEGDWENLRLRFERYDLARKDVTDLSDLTVKRLGAQYNFQICGLNTQGQVRQVGETIDNDLTAASGKINQTMVKLDTCIDEDLSAYTRLNYKSYDYADLPDDKFAGADWTWGLKYRPDENWTVGAEMRSRENPDDNVVSSHIQGWNDFGLSLNYDASRSSMYEAGFRRRRLDYAALNMQDPTVFAILHQVAVITPGDVAPAVSILTPTYDNVYFDMRQCLSDDWRFTTRVDYTQGDEPGTNLVSLNSPSLFFDKQLQRSHGLSWVVDEDNQLDFNFSGTESQNSPRDSNFEQHYLEALWSHQLDCCRNFSLAWRRTDSSLNAPTFTGSDYTTDDVTYVATYGDNEDDIDYALNLSLSDGSGAQDYTQTGAGASLRFKDLGPLGLRVDWYKRSYANFPAMDADNVSVGVDYRIKF